MLNRDRGTNREDRGLVLLNKDEEDEEAASTGGGGCGGDNGVEEYGCYNGRNE